MTGELEAQTTKQTNSELAINDRSTISKRVSDVPLTNVVEDIAVNFGVVMNATLCAKHFLRFLKGTHQGRTFDELTNGLLSQLAANVLN